MEEKQRPKWIVPVGIGCVVLLCLCGLLAGGVALFGNQVLGDLGISDLPGGLEEFIETGELPEPPTNLPVEPDFPEQEPLEEPPPSDTSSLPPQHSDETSFFDDFSSDALDWPVFDDGVTILKYENQAYSFQLTEPGMLDGLWLPTLFSPNFVRFDVWGPPGEQGGTIGVDCQIQDEDFQNHYYVEFDLYYNDVVIGGVVNGEYVDFYDTTENQGWLPLINMPPSPEDPATIEIYCGINQITVNVNGTPEHQIYVPEEYKVSGQGGMSFFMYTFDEAMTGYKVFFDNVQAVP